MRTTLLVLTFIACDSNSINDNNNDMSVNDLAAAQGDMLPDQGAGMSCDPIAQDCPSGQKCTLGGGGGMMMATATCVMAGTVTDGQPCMRTMGADNCAAGLTCARTGGGGGTTTGVCRKYCDGSAGQCDSGQQCAAGRGNTTVGTCTPSCTPFGNDCAGGMNCSTVATALGGGGFFTCRMPGNAGPFEDCGFGAGGATCAGDEVCDNQNMWCAPLCDDAHACPPSSGDGGVAVSCMVVQATGANPGVCSQ